MDVKVESDAVSSIVDSLEDGAWRRLSVTFFGVSTALSSSDKSMNEMGEGAGGIDEAFI